MNEQKSARDELHELIFDKLFRSQNIGAGSELIPAAHELVDALWPVLAQVWEEGRNDALNSGLWTPNPYGEVPR